MGIRGVILGIAVVTSAGGCGGLVTAAQDAGDPGDAGVTGEASAPWSTLCPLERPRVGSLCEPHYGINCQYGCDSVFECNVYGWWAPAPSLLACLSCADGGPVANSPACPSGMQDIAEYGPCPLEAGTTCTYPEGNCLCLETGAPADAGPIWDCAPPAGCPITPPRLGSTCVPPKIPLSCYYEPTGLGIDCDNGTWQGGTCARPRDGG